MSITFKIREKEKTHENIKIERNSKKSLNWQNIKKYQKHLKFSISQKTQKKPNVLRRKSVYQQRKEKC